MRSQETNLGNLTADANLFAARTAAQPPVVSIKNGGGIRAQIGFVDAETGSLLPPEANPVSGKQAGEVSQLDIENTLKFNNSLVLLTVTAAQLKSILEYAVAATTSSGTPGRFPQVGGMAFSFRPRRQGHRNRP